MKEPAAFFQVLATFSDDFDRALAQNTALDEAATKKAEQGQVHRLCDTTWQPWHLANT